MPKYLPLALATLAFVAVVLTLMAIGWRSRRRAQTGLGTLPEIPGKFGPSLHSERVLYVATTRADSPLDRIVAGGLGFRAQLWLQVARDGVLLDGPGSAGLFIPFEVIVGFHTASWTIDKGFKPDGLVVIRWAWNEATVESYLRSDDPPALLAALSSLLAAPVLTEAPTESDTND